MSRSALAVGLRGCGFEPGGDAVGVARVRDEVLEQFPLNVIATPYLVRTPRALAGELDVWERGSDMVLAAHFTQVRCGTATTVETVRFERPERVDFRVVRGPVPHVAESFVLEETEEGSRLTWEGELGTDFWALGAWWGNRAAVVAEAERRAALTAR